MLGRPNLTSRGPDTTFSGPGGRGGGGPGHRAARGKNQFSRKRPVESRACPHWTGDLASIPKHAQTSPSTLRGPPNDIFTHFQPPRPPLAPGKRNRGGRAQTPPRSSPKNAPIRQSGSRAFQNMSGRLDSTPGGPDTASSLLSSPREAPAEPQKQIGDISPSRRPERVPKVTPSDRAAHGLSKTFSDVQIRPPGALMQRYPGAVWGRQLPG